jgi:hypothetical protein
MSEYPVLALSTKKQWKNYGHNDIRSSGMRYIHMI